MDLGLAGKVVLITGGSKGIGLACASAFSAEGARVAICSRVAEHLARAVRAVADGGGAAVPFRCDLTDPVAAAGLVAEVEARIGPLDILVNSAGAARRTAPERLDAAAWRLAMEAKYFTYVHAMQAALPGMVARRRGSIVNIVGQGGKQASATHLPGGAANAALMLSSAGLAAAFGKSGVRVNVINPGLTLTDRAEQAFEAEASRLGLSKDEVRRAGADRIPLGRYADPGEIAAVAVFLASDRASYVTGAILSMDGGATATVV